MAAARTGPYTDVSLTQRGPYTQTVTNPLHKRPAPDDQSRTTVYDADGTDVGALLDAHDNSEVAPPAYSPNYWKKGRDLYANGGGTGQTFLANQG